MRRWLLCAALALTGCGPSEAPPPGDGPDPEEVARLLALGYVDHAQEKADPSRMGVVEIDRARSQPGYRLYCTHRRALVELIDLEGAPVQSWEARDTQQFMACRLLENGDILVVGVARPARGEKQSDQDRYIARLGWEGPTVWQQQIPAHHDVSLTPDGKLATLGLRYRLVPEIDESVPIRDDQMLLLDPDGNLLGERSLYDAITSVPGAVRILPRKTQNKWKRRHKDLLHANTIEWMHHEHLFGRASLYAAGNVLVTLRHQNLVAVVEWETNRLVWSWGQDDLVQPHEGTLLASGNLLIFDNGGERGWSRVIELDPLAKQIVWEYKAPRPADFFTASRGGAVRLPNGNTLISHSNSGEAFEVTPAGERTWTFMTPHLTRKGERLIFRRMSWYPGSMIDAIRERR